MMDLEQKKYIAKRLMGRLGLSSSIFWIYHPCNKIHEAESDSGFISGFIDDQSTRDDETAPLSSGPKMVQTFICTTRLDINAGNRQILIFPLNNEFFKPQQRIRPLVCDPLLYLLIIGSSNHFSEEPL